MKTHILYIIITLLIINIGIFMINIYKQKQISQNNLYDYFYTISRKKSELIVSCELQTINPFFYIGKDTLKSINIQNLIKEKALCFYFSSHTCPPCLDNIRDLIEKIFPDYKERNDIIFISNAMEFRLLENFYEKTIFWNNNKRLGPAFEKSETPTFFILDKDLQAKCVFIADKMTPEYIEDYLQIIKQRFFVKK